jgi:molybdenum cofactor guanylyltransferase
MNKYQDVSGIILLGGKSSRMGENKALLKINGQSVIERLIRMMDNLFENLFLSVSNFGEYGFFEMQMIKDIFPNHGPLSGIHSGLVHSSTQKNFFISCDLPFIDSTTIEYLMNIQSNAPILLPVVGSIPQYDCGIYDKIIIDHIEKMISTNFENKASLKNLIQIVDTKFIQAESFPFFRKELFFNMNTLEDYKFVLEQLEKN